MLLQVLAHVPLCERLTAAKLVCKRWAVAVAAPQLWRTLDLGAQRAWRGDVGRPLLQHLIDESRAFSGGRAAGHPGLCWPGVCPIRVLRLTGCKVIILHVAK